MVEHGLDCWVGVQGMSDLAAPLLYVMRDEAEAFWAFAALMDRCEANFHTDCTCAGSFVLASGTDGAHDKGIVAFVCTLPFVPCPHETLDPHWQGLSNRSV